MITRFAPSPTGYLHLGNVRTALFNWLLAKQGGGVMQLRLEDTDRERSRPEYARAIAEDLHWLGLDFATDADGQPWRQSQRSAHYEEQLARLREHTYPCFCTDAELAAEREAQRAAGKPPRYSGKCARLSSAEAEQRLRTQAAAWRFRVPQGSRLQVEDSVRGSTTYASDDIGDFVLRRANGDFSFLFVNAVDDALLGITDVLRGEDHTTNTPRQLLLLQALNLPAPRYGHIALMVGPGGKPLSKRDGLAPVRDWREKGILPAALVNYLSRTGHTYAAPQADTFLPLPQLAQHFSCAALGRAPAQYDAAQLTRWQKEAVLDLDKEAYLRWLGAARLQGIADKDAFFHLTRENITLPQEGEEWAHLLSATTLPHISAEAAAAIESGKDLYPAAAAAAEAEDWQSFYKAVGVQSGKKGKALFLPLRAALTGRTDGPAMPLIYAMLTPAQRRQRFNAAM